MRIKLNAAAIPRALVMERDGVGCWLYLYNISRFWHLIVFVTTTLVQVPISSSLNFCSSLLTVPCFCPHPCDTLFNNHNALPSHYAHAFATSPTHRLESISPPLWIWADHVIRSDQEHVAELTLCEFLSLQRLSGFHIHSLRMLPTR